MTDRQRVRVRETFGGVLVGLFVLLLIFVGVLSHCPEIYDSISGLERRTVSFASRVTQVPASSCSFPGGCEEMLDKVYVGVTVWRIVDEDEPATWLIDWTNPAASVLLRKDVAACLGRGIFDCFPELDNEAGRRYVQLVLSARRARHTVSVGVTRFRQETDAPKEAHLYYSALVPVDADRVAVVYLDLGPGPLASEPFSIGLDLTTSDVIRIQVQTLDGLVDDLQRRTDLLAEAAHGGT